jgi:hypothetical protein
VKTGKDSTIRIDDMDPIALWICTTIWAGKLLVSKSSRRETVSVEGTAKLILMEWKLKAFGEWLTGRIPTMIKLCMLLLTRVRNLEK